MSTLIPFTGLFDCNATLDEILISPQIKSWDLKNLKITCQRPLSF